MAGVLLVFASTHGHTAKIAARIAEGLRAEGVGEVNVRDAADAGDIDPAAHRAVIVGGSLHAGHHQEQLVDWVRSHRAALDDRPSAFFSVSLTAADDTDEAREATQRCIDDFLAETGWTPARSVAIAGALQYREYSVFTRTLVRLMMRRGGHPTDTSHDYDYTDWEAVERFGREFATLVAQTSR
jgi:menaquinone-dependent protoporphyrinogen oxidase